VVSDLRVEHANVTVIVIDDLLYTVSPKLHRLILTRYNVDVHETILIIFRRTIAGRES